MTSGDADRSQDTIVIFGFRPWVGRAGFSIVLVAALVSVAIVTTLAFAPSARYGWIGEPFVWVYVGTLWAGGLKIWLGARRAIAEARPETLTLRPLHQMRTPVIRWEAVEGTEQMVGGDRLIVYHQTSRGLRFVALNLNLVRGRREFLALIEGRLRAMGFEERVVERSRFLSRPR